MGIKGIRSKKEIIEIGKCVRELREKGYTQEEIDNELKERFNLVKMNKE